MPSNNRNARQFSVLTSPDWEDYELLDSGGGQKLERYGPYTFVRPEHQAIWSPSLPKARWGAADAVFVPSGGESGGEWRFNRKVEPVWVMGYKRLKFRAQTRNSRLMGVLPEGAALWDWIDEKIRWAQDRAPQDEIRVLNLFAYTGIATLSAASAGAHVTHVDASKRAIAEARVNQSLSGLEACPIRWICEDVPKFVSRRSTAWVDLRRTDIGPTKIRPGAEGPGVGILQIAPRPAGRLPTFAR